MDRRLTEKTHGFWSQLRRPIYAMAPMADVTDSAFRQLIASCGKPDLFMTEFVAADGIISRGLPNLMKHLIFDDSERPIVAQLFGEHPESFELAAAIIRELGFDGIDINMGCPVPNVVKTGAGSAMINTPALAKEVIAATRSGAGDLPVSVKTRIGYHSIQLDEWLGHLLEAQPAAITLHLRTRREMSKVPAHWELMASAVEQARGSDCLIIGNGDIRSLAHADELVAQTGMDGAMLGRAIYGNPWLFNRLKDVETIGLEERFEVMLRHARLYEATFGDEKRFVLMRKHLLAHVRNMPGSKQMRHRLGQVETANDVADLLDWYRRNYPISRYTEADSAGCQTG